MITLTIPKGLAIAIIIVICLISTIKTVLEIKLSKLEREERRHENEWHLQMVHILCRAIKDIEERLNK